MRAFSVGLLLLGLAPSAWANPPLGDHEDERRLAIEILEEAIRKAPSTRSNDYAESIRYLRNTRLMVPHSDWDDCMNRSPRPTYMVIFLGRPLVPVNRIYVCRRAEELTLLARAQALIHETVHLSGNLNECPAARYEVNAMRDAGREVYKTGYWDYCGLN